MADKHPYISGSGPLVQVIGHLRKSFPAAVTADTLKKLGFAPNNESYVINILKFIKVIDDQGKKTQDATTVFTKHDDAEFRAGLSKLIEAAYSDLFSLHAESAWSLEQGKLISYFRSSDQSSDVVGRRQATTFQTLSSLAGKTEPPSARSAAGSNGEGARRKTKAEPRGNGSSPPKKKLSESGSLKAEKIRDVGLTVRIEVNLPADGNQETYDRIFRSIRENLINAE